jgi:hypothetical protein
LESRGISRATSPLGSSNRQTMKYDGGHRPKKEEGEGFQHAGQSFRFLLEAA